MKKAYITVFFTIAVGMIMSLLIGMFYGIRENAIRMKAVSATDTAMTSIFAEYERDLWDLYGLVFVDSSYKSKSSTMALVNEHTKKCLEKNFDEIEMGLLGGKDLLKLSCSDAETTAVCLASDENGTAIKLQAVNYMKYYVKLSYADDIGSWIQTIEDYGLGNGASYSEAIVAADELASKYDLDYSGWLPSLTGGNDISEDTIPPIGLLAFITDIDKVSKTKINSKDYAGKRRLNEGNLKKETTFDITAPFFLREYFLTNCGHYLDTKDHGLLSYQIEYLCCGKDSDCDNLASMARRIMVIREAANMATLYASPTKIYIIEALCSLLATLLEIPEATDLFVAIVVACWANFESLMDLKILFKGGKVPLIKTPEQWITGVEAALNGTFGDAEYSEGLSYEDYLRIFMYLTGEKKVMKRFMSILEMDVRKTGHNEYFRIDNCFDELQMNIYINSEHGYDYMLTRRRKVLN